MKIGQKIRVILDVNVWISAILWGGVPDKILMLAEANKISIFISKPLFKEFENTLSRPKFQSKLKSLNLQIEEIINSAQKIIQFYPTISVNISQLRDPKDLIVIEAAIASNAEVIITGDLDLLVLKEVNNIPILNPQDFLNRYFPIN